jgi:hypothetical protein
MMNDDLGQSSNSGLLVPNLQYSLVVRLSSTEVLRRSYNMKVHVCSYLTYGTYTGASRASLEKRKNTKIDNKHTTNRVISKRLSEVQRIVLRTIY